VAFVATDKVWTAAATNDWNATIAAEFRGSAGKVGGRFEGADLLLLHSVGRRTGEARMTPLMYLADGDRYVVFGTYAGNPKNPAWYHNVKADSEVTIEVASEGEILTRPAEAIELEGPDRDVLYARQVELFPGFDRYEKKSGRRIPVVALLPR
jgi:deazaflavin-dependent oxidoreductase (nitroreductase family)